METIEAKDVKVLSIADPRFTTMDLNVAWNESELERSAKIYAERFKGLLVTEDNLDEMKHAASVSMAATMVKDAVAKGAKVWKK